MALGNVKSFILAIVAGIIAINLVPTLMDAVSGSTIPLVTSGIVGVVVGAGVTLYFVGEFL